MARFVPLFLTVALIAAACGSSADEASPGDDAVTTDGAAAATDTPDTDNPVTDGTDAADNDASTTTEPPVLTASHRGVTEEVIRVGVLTFDWDGLAALGVDFGRSNSEDLYIAALEEINERGGIYGRMLEPHVVTFLPVGSTGSDAACVELTEDKEIFVVTGTPLNDQILCFTELHQTAAVVANGLTAQRQARAQAPYAAVVAQAEERTAAFIELMEETGALDDATIGVSGSVDVSEANFDVMIESLRTAGYEPLEGLIGGNEGDLAASARAQETIYQRMIDAGVNVTIETSGVPLTMANAQAAGYQSDQWLMSTIMTGRGLTDAGVDHDFLDGALAVSNTPIGTSAQPALADDPLASACVDELEERTGRELPYSLDPPVNDLAAGLFACALASILEEALLNAGPDLTNATFQAGLEAIGEIDLPGYTNASLGPDKMGAAEGLNVVRFDGATGVWEPLG